MREIEDDLLMEKNPRPLDVDDVALLKSYVSYLSLLLCTALPFFFLRFHLGINPLRRVMHLVYWLIVLTGRSMLRRFLNQCMLTFACHTLNSISLMPGCGKSYKVARPVTEIGMNQ
jgi:hypothetical protein